MNETRTAQEICGEQKEKARRRLGSKEGVHRGTTRARTLGNAPHRMQLDLQFLADAACAPCTCNGESKNLFRAASINCLQCCAKHIKKAGKEYQGSTAMMAAAQNGHANIVRLLLPKEAKMQNQLGQTALMRAVAANHLHVIGMLAPYEVGMASRNGSTALMEAAKNGSLEAAWILLPYEARMQNDDGFSALMLAVRLNKALMAGLLAPHEAGLVGHGGETALNMAIDHSYADCFDILRQRPEEMAASGIKPAMLAAYDGDVRTLVALKSKWTDRFRERTTAFGMALFGRQKRSLHYLAREEEVRKQFAFSSIPNTEREYPAPWNVVQGLAHPACGKALLHVLCGAGAGRRSHITSILYNQDNGVARRLIAPFCGLTSRDLISFTKRCYGRNAALMTLQRQKSIGLISEGTTVLSTKFSNVDEFRQHITQNPLRLKQVQLAEGQLVKVSGQQRTVPEPRQFGWRETESEQLFNRRLLLEARDLAWLALAAPQRTFGRETNKIREKRVLNRRLLLAALRFMQRVVQEMLDE